MFEILFFYIALSILSSILLVAASMRSAQLSDMELAQAFSGEGPS